MIDPRKQQLIDELIKHLEDSQGGELAGLMEEHNKPKETDGLSLAGEQPKGLSVDKVSVMPKDPAKDALAQALGGSEPDGDEAPGMSEDEPSDDELLELLKKYSS